MGGAVAEAALHLVEFLQPGAGVLTALASGAIVSLFSRHAEAQTKYLIEELRDRIVRLEQTGRLDRDRLARLEGELGGLQAIASNALAVPAKVEVYADLLAGMVAVEASSAAHPLAPALFRGERRAVPPGQPRNCSSSPRSWSA